MNSFITKVFENVYDSNNNILKTAGNMPRFKFSTKFTRPADTTQYTANDSISNLSSATAVTFQETDNTVTLNSHGLQNGSVVSFATVVTTTGISQDTNYFVINSDTNTFKLSLTYNGSAISLTNDGTGTINATTLCYDLSLFGAINGQFFRITNVSIISNLKASALSLNANVWIFNSIFKNTFDNSELAIDDDISNSGGIVVPCTSSFSNANNHRCVASGDWRERLSLSDTKLFVSLQAANGYTPQSGEIIYLVIEGDLL